MICFTTLIYALGKAVGPQQAANYFNQWVQQGRGEAPLDCLATLRAVQRVYSAEPIGVLVDAGGAHIGKARSRLFTLAFEQMKDDDDVWLTVDDDVRVPPGTVKVLIDAARGPGPRIVTVPYALRGQAASSSSLVGSNGQALTQADPTSIDVTWRKPVDGEVVPENLHPIHSAGFGCVAMNRQAMEVMAAQSILFYEIERQWWGPFADYYGDYGGPDGRNYVQWYGEDRSFFARVPKNVSCYSLIVGESSHAGLTLDLGKVQR